MASFVELLRCPSCRGSLEGGVALRCPACEREYPPLGDIPLLLERPEEQRSAWSSGLAQFMAEMDEAAKYMARSLVSAERLPLTRERLTTVVEGLPRHRDAIARLFAEVGVEPARSFVSAPGEASILAYYTLIHRDYAWPPDVDEVTPSVEAIASIVPSDFTLGRTVILGAGTARLAWELGRRLPGAGTLVALDVNPLPLIVTSRLLRGESVTLFEVPGHPKRGAAAVVERTLAPPGAPPPGLHLLLADGLEPPLARGVFDTVITPWFVDQVPADAAAVVPLVFDLLREGGSYINHGPFVYEPAHTEPAHRYSAGEFLQMLARGGFEVTGSTYETVPYCASPLSSQGRTETVLTVHARKGAAPAPAKLEPDFLRAETRDHTPVPVLPGLSAYEAPHPMLAQVAKLIDGQRTARDIGRVLVAAGAIARDGNEEMVVYACLKVLYRALGGAGSR